jgi:hypothetical protein
MDNWTMEAVLGIARHVLTTLGGSLVTDGILSSSQMTDTVGAIITLFGVGWSVLSKHQANRKLVAAKAS